MTQPAVERQNYNFTLAILIFAGISIALQQTMVVPALPELQREFDTTTAWATWLLTGFLLSASVATPLLGRLGDQYGKERVLLISLLIFFTGSVAAIFAPNIAVLIGCRILQGTGAAVFPLSFAIIKDEFPAEKVSVAVGAVSAVFAVGGGLGLVLSGVIMDNLSWHWLFVVGAVAVGIAAVLVHLYVPESPIKSPSRVDFIGATLLSVGLVALLVALTEGESWGWGSTRVVGLFTVAAVALVAWGYAETKVPDPMVDMRMLARRPVFFANLTGLIAGFAMFGSFVLVPNFVQISEDVAGYGFGASATTTGLYLVPAALAGFLMGPLAGIMGRRWGSKWPLSIGMTLATIALHDARGVARPAMAGRCGDARLRPGHPDDLRGDGEHHRDRRPPDRDGRGDRDEHRHAHDRRRDRRTGGSGDPDGGDGAARHPAGNGVHDRVLDQRFRCAGRGGGGAAHHSPPRA